MKREDKTCRTCGNETAVIGARICDACWEVESRLADYLRRGGQKAIDFVATELAKASKR